MDTSLLKRVYILNTEPAAKKLQENWHGSKQSCLAEKSLEPVPCSVAE
jgi:hypothetical protein